MKRKLREVDTVHFLAPYAFDLLIGGAYNRAIEMLPPGAWICINDHDTLKPPGFAERVKFVIEYEIEDPASWLVGCKTNRMSRANPNVVQAMHEEDSLSAHLVCAAQLWEKHKTALEPNHEVAGYCMIFHRSLWERVGGFPPRSIRFDSWLSERSSCWTASGIYLIHLYRWHQRKNPEKSYSHLLRAGRLCTDPWRP